MRALTDLSGKVALVTGGGTGMCLLYVRHAYRGLMIAKGLASGGAKVYISGRRFEILQEEAVKFGGDGGLVPLRLDVTDKASILAAVETVQNADGKLDVLVNNAGISGPGDITLSACLSPSQSFEAYGKTLFDIQSFEQWEAVSRINVASVFFVTTAFLGLLDASTHGLEGATASVINISSTVAHGTLSWGYHAYTSLKAATSHLTHVFATELSLKRAPIRVNAISPGVFASQLTSLANSQELEKITKTPMMLLQPIPAMRPGSEEEMAALAVYLASPASAYMHGQDIVLDGANLES
ncbi:hypothetical protein EW145_g7641 [Phellinidium pouzarii]|uniref:Ketoreductase (KR) domain-containing protein n=1 Tax=Phellinidium pouzarii TaxID=167371 RepID=A0A4V3XA98_9AGAM|nr:hypothetical protein EW145_g7641 [Phellinidium pouzarii]